MLTQEEIREIAGHPMSWSRLKHYDKSPAHFLDAWRNPPEPTPAMTLGSALHCLVLEPDKYESRYVVAPEAIDRRTKDGKAAWAEFQSKAAGRTVLTPDQHMQANDMAGAILASSTASKALAVCPHREHTITWTDPATDLPCKGVLDAWGDRWVIDVKTTDDASDCAFSRSIANYMYHGQAAFYLDGLLENGHDVRFFLFIVVEKNRPHGVRTFMASSEMLSVGRQLYSRLLAVHAECVSAGEWPGYPDGVENIDLPAWAA